MPARSLLTSRLSKCNFNPHLIHGSWTHMSQPQTASRSVQPFCTAYPWAQHTDTQRHTDHATCDICSIDRIYALHAAMWPHHNKEQGVALTGRNTTGPPCSVGRPIAHAPCRRRADRPRVQRPAALQTTTDDDRRRRPTTASKTILAH